MVMYSYQLVLELCENSIFLCFDMKVFEARL